MELEPDPSGGQGLPSELPDPVVRTGPLTEHVDFLTSRDVLDILHGGRNLVGAGWVHRTGTWKPWQKVVLPQSPRKDSPYRLCFAVEFGGEHVVPLQQCVDTRVEKDHTVAASQWRLSSVSFLG